MSREIDDASLEKRKITAFQSKSISVFASAIRPHLTRVFGDKYPLKTAQGKLQLQKDISILRAACNNKTPENTGNDQELFTLLLGLSYNCNLKSTVEPQLHVCLSLRIHTFNSITDDSSKKCTVDGSMPNIY